ncbi:hypothetical protein MTP99_005394 [Tenebrio molitor]|nr:hypothetical protein MTP99_005394 [Tenebrio molitor]
MASNIFFTVLVLVLVNWSSSQSSTVNSIFKSNMLLQLNQALNPVLMDSVMNGAQTAMNECKNVFKWSRWNCPQSAFSKQYKHLSTKEKAYTDAIIAAGIIYSITQDCSQGVIKGCGCDPNRQEPQDDSKVLNQIEKDWTWGGCSHDASYGEDLVLKMLESNEKDSDAQAFVSRHNNRVGREIIREKMLKKCKCHGVSGSCSFQTCWMQMPSFTEIAKELRDRYHNSILISFEKVREGLTLGNSARHLPLVEDHLPNNLVYLERSDSFCFSNNTTGIAGTKGRVCSRTTARNATIEERKSCRNLCRSCGYKVRKYEKQTTYQCNCKFSWCCDVKCDLCVQKENEFFCA